jgi:hypothetical protein
MARELVRPKLAIWNNEDEQVILSNNYFLTWENNCCNYCTGVYVGNITRNGQAKIVA